MRVRGALRAALTFLAVSSVTFAGAAFADNNQVIVREQYGKYGGTDLSVTQDTTGDDNLVYVKAQKATGKATLHVNQSGSSNGFGIGQSSAGDFVNDDASLNHNNSISALQSGDDTISIDTQTAKKDITASFTQGGSNTIIIGTQQATDGSIDLSVTQNSNNYIEVDRQVAGTDISSTITQDSSNNEVHIRDSEAGASITDQITQSGALENKIDYLVLGGQRMEVPTDEIVLFSTNLDPMKIVDDAFLRRLPYKINVRNPRVDEYTEIWKSMAEKLSLKFLKSKKSISSCTLPHLSMWANL